jgi:phosphate transport system substrate-binding protein
MKFFRWLGIVSAALLVLSSLFVVVYPSADRALRGVPDKTGAYASINTLGERPENWQRFVATPLYNALDFPKIDGSTVTMPMTMELARQLAGADETTARMLTNHATTHPAYENLIAGECDIILVTEPSEEELALAEAKGIALDVQPFARDAFVFITHERNPVTTLTVAQIQGIFAGEIVDWSEVGGPQRAIRAYQREVNSGSQTTMLEVVMQGRAMAAPKTIPIAYGMAGLVEAVAEYRNGMASIGYTFEYYIKNLYRNDAIKELAVDGIAPTFPTIRDGSYPFTTSYFAVIRAGDTGQGKVVRDFLLSDAGQRSVAQAGFCPVREVP